MDSPLMKMTGEDGGTGEGGVGGTGRGGGLSPSPQPLLTLMVLPPSSSSPPSALSMAGWSASAPSSWSSGGGSSSLLLSRGSMVCFPCLKLMARCDHRMVSGERALGAGSFGFGNSRYHFYHSVPTLIIYKISFFPASFLVLCTNVDFLNRPWTDDLTPLSQYVIPLGWWWEQQIDLDIHHALGSDDRRELVQSMPHSVVWQRGKRGNNWANRTRSVTPFSYGDYLCYCVCHSFVLILVVKTSGGVGGTSSGLW